MNDDRELRYRLVDAAASGNVCHEPAGRDSDVPLCGAVLRRVTQLWRSAGNDDELCSACQDLVKKRRMADDQ